MASLSLNVPAGFASFLVKCHFIACDFEFRDKTEQGTLIMH